MHHHKCKQPLANNQVCGQIVACVQGASCAECEDDHRCSAHMLEDSPHYVPPTPPAKK